MEVCSAVSGETLAFFDVDAFQGKSAKAVKQSLAVQIGVPRFRQRLFREDSSDQIPDEEVFISTSVKVQLVLVEFEPFETETQPDMSSACRDNDAVALERLLQIPQNPDLKDVSGRGPLHHAAEQGHVKPVQLLLEAAAEKNLQNTDGHTPLYSAASHGHVEVARMLIEANADSNQATTKDGAAPLYIAAQKGHEEVVRLLIEAGANKNQIATNFGASPLYIAAQKGHLEVVRMLLGAGADKNQAAATGASPLYIAASCGHLEVVRLLIGAGADRNQARTDTGVSPMCIASQNGHKAVVRLLLEDSPVLQPMGNEPRLIQAGSDTSKFFASVWFDWLFWVYSYIPTECTPSTVYCKWLLSVFDIWYKLK